MKEVTGIIFPNRFMRKTSCIFSLTPFSRSTWATKNDNYVKGISGRQRGERAESLNKEIVRIVADKSAEACLALKREDFLQSL